ncbi:heat-inducible transcriptional repressor HrcA [Fusobacterium sp. PH5-44]|uniref:heat-inducible transcriptional repressor HrcA n=1 Tax=unclassified Fusobacterium TaxID=2648384 RepID=UPI003D24968A
MSISEREKLVLNAIINYYLTYGDTIGSRTLVKKYNIDLSSATIRNVMADLEDMGYIEKTHTSSGRIPTDKGYKYYLTELLKIEKITQEEKNNIELAYEQHINALDHLLEKTSSLLSKLTTYAGIALEPSTLQDKIKKIELVFIDQYTAFAVVVKNSGLIKTRKIMLKTPITKEELDSISLNLNKNISSGNYSMLEIEKIVSGKENEAITNNDNTLIWDELQDSFEDEGKLFVNNMPSIFKDRSVSEVSEVMDFFNNRKDMIQLFKDIVENKKVENGKVDVILGEELGIKGLEDFSFVYSVYQLGSSKGILGVIGPKRMAYSKTMGLIKHVSVEVNKVISDINNKSNTNDK